MGEVLVAQPLLFAADYRLGLPGDKATSAADGK